MHLSDRPRRQGVGVDAREHVLPWNAELLLHHRDDLRLGEGRDLVLKLCELCGERGWHEIRASREDLTQLREGGPELLQRVAELLRPLFGRGRARFESELRQNAADLSRASEQTPFDLGLGGRDGSRGTVGRVHDHHRAAGAM
jgi:hypothetical protein